MDAVTLTILGTPSHTILAHPPCPTSLTTLPASKWPHVAPLSVAPSPVPTAVAPIINPALLTNRNVGITLPASLGRGWQRTLAQPMGQNWTRNRESALADAAASKSLKTQRQEIDDKKKRTCEVLIWFKVGTQL